MPNRRSLMDPQDKGFFQNLIMQAKLILRLMGDRRVSIFLKLLPVAALVYVISPVDLIPGIVLPVVGALDDAAVIWLGASLFVSLCPDAVVREHTQALENGLPASWPSGPGKVKEDEIIDAVAKDSIESEQKLMTAVDRKGGE